MLVAGLGDPAKVDAGVFERVGGAIAARLLTSGETAVTVDFADVAAMLSGVTASLPLAEATAHLAHGAVLRSYRFDKYHTKLKPKQLPTLVRTHHRRRARGIASCSTRQALGPSPTVSR